MQTTEVNTQSFWTNSNLLASSRGVPIIGSADKSATDKLIFYHIGNW